MHLSHWQSKYHVSCSCFFRCCNELKNLLCDEGHLYDLQIMNHQYYRFARMFWPAPETSSDSWCLIALLRFIIRTQDKAGRYSIPLLYAPRKPFLRDIILGTILICFSVTMELFLYNLSVMLSLSSMYAKMQSKRSVAGQSYSQTCCNKP